MKIEEAIRELTLQERMRSKCLDYRVNNLVIATAVDALKKQDVKQIRIYANGEEHCPTCDENLTGLGFKRCIECGQLLTWEVV